jgi:selenocysteine lyase/cysteine desulfurase
VDKFDHWNLGTYNSALQAGIAPAIQLHQAIGTPLVQARLQELTRFWTGRLRSLPGFRLHTPLDQDQYGAVALFSVDGVDAQTVERQLRADHHVHVKHRRVGSLEGLRVSPHVFTLKSELDRFVDAVASVVEAAPPTTTPKPTSVLA